MEFNTRAERVKEKEKQGKDRGEKGKQIQGSVLSPWTQSLRKQPVIGSHTGLPDEHRKPSSILIPDDHK